MEINKRDKTITSRMINFKKEFDTESAVVDADIDALPIYLEIHRRIAEDDLPTYEQSFTEYLNDKVVMGIINFQTQLELHEKSIRKRVNELNTPLQRVPYTAQSHIQLVMNSTKNEEIRKFRDDLKSCRPNVGQMNNPAELQRAFDRVTPLMERFGKDTEWMARVMDTRRWLEFSAQEIHSTEGTVLQHYTDSSGKSGGERAKLAYTILAAALAYQYGVHEDYGKRGHSFRFVVIDEAFSKLDDSNARYAMELFDKLGLQLLVVTPMDKLHVLQSYVKAYHFVWNSAEGNYSQLLNMNAEQYRQRLNQDKPSS